MRSSVDFLPPFAHTLAQSLLDSRSICLGSQVMSRAAKGSGPKCCILLLPRGNQPRATPDLRVYSISHTTSKVACFWVAFPQFWSILDRFWSFLAVFGWYSSAILRVYLIFQFLSTEYHVLLSADGQSNVRAI